MGKGSVFESLGIRKRGCMLCACRTTLSETGVLFWMMNSNGVASTPRERFCSHFKRLFPSTHAIRSMRHTLPHPLDPLKTEPRPPPHHILAPPDSTASISAALHLPLLNLSGSSSLSKNSPSFGLTLPKLFPDLALNIPREPLEDGEEEEEEEEDWEGLCFWDFGWFLSGPCCCAVWR